MDDGISCLRIVWEVFFFSVCLHLFFLKIMCFTRLYVCVGWGGGFGLLCQEGGVNGCLGGDMDLKPDSTGTGALAK